PPRCRPCALAREVAVTSAARTAVATSVGLRMPTRSAGSLPYPTGGNLPENRDPISGDWAVVLRRLTPVQDTRQAEGRAIEQCGILATRSTPPLPWRSAAAARP